MIHIVATSDRHVAGSAPEDMLNDLVIRRATPADAPEIAKIYNHYVVTSTATFDTLEKTVEDRIEWLASHDERHPVLVAQSGERVVAWGCVTPWGVRPGWKHTVELSIYVAPESLGAGIGRRVHDALVEVARSAGHHALIVQIVAENERSLKMSERAGFMPIGTMREVGRKFDRWIDLVLLERVLD